jgi:hypothetical protein
MISLARSRASWLLLGIGIALFVTVLQVFFYPWGGLAIIGLFLLLVAVTVIWLHPYWALVFLIVFMPLEDFVLKFVPGPEQVFFVSQFASELLIYLTFGLVLTKRLLQERRLRGAPINLPLAIFIIAATLSIIINRSPLVGSLLNLHSMLRYVVLFYLVINLDLTPPQINRLLRIILLMGAVEIVVSLAQLAGGGAVKSLFLPRQSSLEAFGQTRNFTLVSRGRELGSVFGTLGDTLFLGLFMLTVLAVYLSKLKRLTAWHLLGIAIIVLIVGYSYSRAALLCALIMLFLWYACFYRPAGAAVIALGVLLLVSIGVLAIASAPPGQPQYVNPRQAQSNIVGNLTSIFSKSYLQAAERQRLGAIVQVPMVVLKEHPILGYGPDQETTIERLNKTELPTSYKLLSSRGFEDVYWVAILSYYGLVGLITVVWMLGTLLYRSWRYYQRTEDPLIRSLAIASFLTLILAPFLLLFYRVLEFRSYSFYLWLLPALMLNLYAQRRRQFDPREEYAPQP